MQWLGVLPEEEKVRRLAAADVLAAPSLGGESFGMVLLEAMAARTVVVASDIDGYRAASRGLCRAGAARGRPAPWPRPSPACSTAASLRPRARARRSDPRPDRGAWLDRGSERAEQWSMEVLAGRYEELYRAVDGRGRPLSGRTLLGR